MKNNLNLHLICKHCHKTFVIDTVTDTTCFDYCSDACRNGTTIVYHHNKWNIGADNILNKLYNKRVRLSRKKGNEERIAEIDNLISLYKQKYKHLTERYKKMDAEELLAVVGYYDK